MKERRTLVCISNGKKIALPNVSKVIIAVRNVKRQQVQASVDINEGNIRRIRSVIVREKVNLPGKEARPSVGLTFPKVWPSGAPVSPDVRARYKRELKKVKAGGRS